MFLCILAATGGMLQLLVDCYCIYDYYLAFYFYYCLKIRLCVGFDVCRVEIATILLIIYFVIIFFCLKNSLFSVCTHM